MNFWKRLFSRNQQEEVEDPTYEPEGNSWFRFDGELISRETDPIKVYLLSKREFSQAEKDFMTSIITEDYRKGMKDSLSNLAVKIIFRLNIVRPVRIIQLEEGVFQIMIVK